MASSATTEPLAGADAAWLRMDRPENLMMITAVLMMERPIELGALKALFEERFLIFERFRQRVRSRRSSPYWQTDSGFDLDRHIHRLALPGEGGQKELQDLVSDLMSTPLDLSKPPWQIHLVENYGDGCALIGRLHHCIADGIALVHVLLSLADENFDPKHLPVAPSEPRRDDGTLGKLIRPVAKAVDQTVKATGNVLGAGLDLIRDPSQLVDLAKQGMSVGAAASRLALLGADSDTVFRGPLSTSKLAVWSQPVPLSQVKSIAQGVGGKINDVLLAAVAGGLRRYLRGHAKPVRDVEIRAVIPVNLRPLDQAFELGNKFGLVFLTLPVGVAAPHERLVEVKRRMDKVKYSSEAGVIFGLLQVAGSGPKEMQDALVSLLSQKASAVMTNVPGPRERLHLAGSAIRKMMFWVPRAGTISLGVSIMSYAGEVFLGVSTDAGLVDDPERIITGFHEELDALADRFA